MPDPLRYLPTLFHYSSLSKFLCEGCARLPAFNVSVYFGLMAQVSGLTKMAKHVSELHIYFSDFSMNTLRFRENQKYIDGKTSKPRLGGAGLFYRLLGYLIMALSFGGLMGICIYIYGFSHSANFNWFTASFSMLSCVGCFFIGWDLFMDLRTNWSRLRNTATALLVGSVINFDRRYGGLIVIITYRFMAPSGEQILGKMRLGLLDRMRLELGGKFKRVIVLYADDRHHTLI